MSHSWFLSGSFSLAELEFGDVGFRAGRKTGEPGEKPSGQGENQQQTQPTYGTGGPFLEGPETFLHPKSRSEISNVMIT